MPNAKAKILSKITATVDSVELKSFMDMHGYPFGFSLSPFVFPRYPPAAIGPMNINPTKLKEKILREDLTFSAKLHDFSNAYLRHASGLLDMSSSMFLPGHTMNRPRIDNITQEEIEKLRKENTVLKKRLEQLTKNKKQSN
jgi:hypothetical protein